MALALWLLAGLAPAAGQAPPQGSCRPPIVTFPPARHVLDPGDSYHLPFAIENPNGHVDIARADVRVTTPDGWTAIPARRELTLPPEGVQQNVLALTAPTRGTGAPAGNITISVTLVCVTGVVQQSSLPAEHVVDVRIRGFDAPWPLVLGAFAILAVGVGLLGVRRLRRGVILAPATPERPVEPGKSAKYTFVVHNRRGKPASYRLVGEGLPEGWSIHLALDEVDLEPGEEKTLWAIVKAPAGAPPGAHVPFTLRLVGGRGPRDGASASLAAHVQAPA